MTRFTAEQINKIIGLKGADGKPIDIFDLHGLLYIGNSENSIYDLTKTYTRFSEHSLGISPEDFDWCETEDQVNEQFFESLRDAITDKLI